MQAERQQTSLLMGTTGERKQLNGASSTMRVTTNNPKGTLRHFYGGPTSPHSFLFHSGSIIMNVAGPVRASRPIDGGNNGKLRNSSHGGGDAGGGVDMYLDVPSFELSLDEFEEFALSRLKVRVSQAQLLFPHHLFCCILLYSPYLSYCCRVNVDGSVDDLYDAERRCLLL